MYERQRRSGVLLLTPNRFHTLIWCFLRLLWTMPAGSVY